MDTITIIIPHLGTDKNQIYAMQQCYKSLEETAPGVKKLLVKNGPRLEDYDEDIYIKEQGQCRAVNAGIAICNSKWVFVTNDDMIYAPQWLEKMMETVKRYKLKFLCPNLVEPQAGAPPFIVKFFGGAGGDFNKDGWMEFAKNHTEKKMEEGFNLPFLIERELWNRIGGYDVNYDPWGSNGDSDLQAKLILGGITTFRDRNIIVYHFSQTSGTFHPNNYNYWTQNFAYFEKKWGFERQPANEKVWYSRDIIDPCKLVYKPEWMGKLKECGTIVAKFNQYGY